MRPDQKARIRWRAFQLNPDMQPVGMDRWTYLETKFGGSENATRVYSNIAAVGHSVGIDFRFDLIETTPSTLDTHRLIRFLQDMEHPQCTDFVTRLFEAYFLEGRNIGETAVMLALAEELGIETDGLEDFLASDRLCQEILNEDVLARRIGINGVPCFIIDGQYALSGAQEPEAFMPLFDLATNNDRLKTANQ